MGNAMGGRTKRSTKVMKIDGQTFNLTTPATALDVLNHHPDHVLLESDAVKHLGHRAKPLEPHHHLHPSKLYFLLHLPHLLADNPPASVGAGAMSRLERLMLSRTRASEVRVVGPGSNGEPSGPSEGETGPGSDVELCGPPVGETGPIRVKVRLPRAQVEKVVKESKDKTEVAEKIVRLFVRDEVDGGGSDGRLEPLVREKKVSFLE